eukprot:gene25728-biopygen18019
MMFMEVPWFHGIPMVCTELPWFSWNSHGFLGFPWIPMDALEFPPNSGLKHAPQRRGYTRSLPMGPIDGTHGCPQKT